MADKLAVMFPQGKSLSIQDTNLTIKPFKFGELPKVFKAIEPISSTLFSALQGSNQFEMIAGMIANGGDSVIDLMVIGSRQPRDWIEQLDLDEGIELLTSIVEVNADFFIRKVLPGLNDRLEQLQAPDGKTQ